KFLIGGNWKNCKDFTTFQHLILSKNYDKVVKNAKTLAKIDVFVAVPNIWIGDAEKLLEFSLGIQDISACDETVTGEVLADMVRDKVSYAIIGHSERRTVLGESNEMIQKKVKYALSSGIRPILCIGENIQQRQSDNFLHFLKNQLISSIPMGVERALLHQINKNIDSVNESEITDIGSNSENICLSEDYQILSEVLNTHLSDSYLDTMEMHLELDIAYEPLWAIGKESATLEQIEMVAQNIEEWMLKYNIRGRIIYGGAVTDENAEKILRIKNINGLLIGGASLDERFINILEIARTNSRDLK
ncbi:unnamed protein product, partial [Medioppia subpectinata]